MRLAGWQVCPVIYADDGENLEPFPVQPQFVTAGQWEAFKTGGDKAALEHIRAQVEGGNGG